MTLDQAQTDRGTVMSVLNNLDKTVANFKIFFKELEDLKNAVVSDPSRRAELEAYFKNCECTMSWADVVTAYQRFKNINEAMA